MRTAIVACVLLLAAACRQPSTEYKSFLNDPRLFSHTVHELNQVVMGNNFSPIVASRNYTYAAMAAYEVIAAGYPSRYQSLAGQVNDLKAMPSPQGDRINYELAALLAYIKVGEAVTFPEGSMQVYRDSILELARDKGLPDDEEEQSIAFADTVAKALIAWSKTDNYAKTRGAQKFTVMPDVAGRWVPTPPMYADAAEPNWAQIRPLVMDSATQFVPPAPLPFNMTDKNSPYYQQVKAVYDSSKQMTKEEEHIAWFWDDNPFKLNVSGHVMFSTKKFSPPGHWMGIVGIAAQKAKADYAETVYAYAITAIAGFDAFIQCWEAKYRYATVRPETVINKYIDPEWRPLLQTPAFPEYTCGHSTTSAASAEALTKVFGDNFAYTDTTELEFGIESRSFRSFRHAAEENNLARFYGGIHFHPSCLVSTDYGTRVGQLVVTRLKMKK